MTDRPAARRTAGTTSAALALLAVTAVWGSTFPVIKDAVADLPVADFLGVRFAIAAAAMVAVAPRALAGLTRAQRWQGAALGLVYGGGQLLQTAGLHLVAASVSGFLTGLYVVLTPVLAAVLLRHRPGAGAWVATALATLGLAVIALPGRSIGGGSLLAGDLLTVGSAALYALHIVGLGRWSPRGSPWGFTQVQLLVVAAVCLAGALPGGVELPRAASGWLAIGYTAVVAGALALAVQTWAQSRLPPVRAAVLMTMEPVFAAGFAALGGERLGVRTLAGGALVLAAMYVSELAPALRRRGAGGPAPDTTDLVPADPLPR